MLDVFVFSKSLTFSSHESQWDWGGTKKVGVPQSVLK